MVCAPFEYVRAGTFDEAVGVLIEHGEDAQLLAGGQSLVPMLALRLARPTVLVDINDIGALPPEADGAVLPLPTLTRHRVLLDSPVVAREVPLLADCVRHIGNVRVRNRGTVGGSMAHADPTGEIACVALTLDAQVVAHGPAGRRTIGARDFFVTYLTTALEPAEVLAEVRFPVLRPGQGWSFQEMVRRVSDFAVVAVSASVDLEPDGATVRAIDVALAGVADRPVLAEREALAPLLGTTAARDLVASAARSVADATSPEGDVHASGAYRRRLVDVLTRRAITEALDRAREGSIAA
ncbi:MAG: carbon monoxide dehydrogenase [Pseudonocardiaceae bacterium]|nr:carbon monoxide dehydrogenase [Pseudonocardiaceae bacterium]